MRTLALAQMLSSDFECIFAIQQPSKELQQQISEVCDGLISLPACTPEEERFVHELDAYISEEEIVVLDGYSFGTAYQKSIKAKGATLVCIDDIHHYPFVADAVINHGTLDPAPYQVAYFTKLLLGLKYALLRPPFLAKDNKVKTGKGIFLCFGGSDPQNLTQRYLSFIIDAGIKAPVQVVVGSAYTYFDELQAYVRQQRKDIKITLHQNVSAQELAQVIGSCKIAVVPGSSIALECAGLGLHLVCGYYVDNQKGILKMLTDAGVAVNLGNLQEASSDMFSEALLQAQQQGKEVTGQLFAGNSPAHNLLKEFKKLSTAAQLQIREAQEADVELYFNWANDPETRANAINQDPILYNSHVQWYNGKIKSAQSYLYLLSLQDAPVGQVRFDAEGDAFLIDYSVAPEHRGLGLGRSGLIKAIEQLKKAESAAPLLLKALVKDTNVASKAVFESLHFKRTGHESINQEDYTQYELRIA